jgi:hypothetical protein
MGSERFKINSVIIDGGSGVLCQPYNNNEFTYVLSAKHNFYNKTGQQNIIKENVGLSFYNTQDTSVLINVNLGRNYFEHSNSAIDAAVLKIDYKENIEEIFIDENCDAYNECFLCGYPSNLRGNGKDKYTFYGISRKIDITQNGGYLRLQSNFGTFVCS